MGSALGSKKLDNLKPSGSVLSVDFAVFLTCGIVISNPRIKLNAPTTKEKMKMLVNPTEPMSRIPIKGPIAVANTVLKLKYPIPSPFLLLGITCDTIVPVDVVAIPSPTPCKRRIKKSKAILPGIK
ncbi:hypothetical protein D3C81_1521580 [compost metagenome]